MGDSNKIVVDEGQIIEDEFQALLNDYLNSNHRRKVEIITRAFNMAKEAQKAPAVVPVKLISYILICGTYCFKRNWARLYFYFCSIIA